MQNMPKYQRKIRVLLTENEFRNLGKIAEQQKKKLGTLVREAIAEYPLKPFRQRPIAEAVDRLLALPDVPAPENGEQFEEELARAHGFHE
jgi:hypothetical protein